jgi:hypothetical protein
MTKLVCKSVILLLLGISSQSFAEWEFATIDDAAPVGGYVELAFDSQGNEHVAYADNGADNLKYAYYDGNSWLVEVVDSDGEIISIDALKKVMPIVMDRGGLVMFEHTNKPVGKIISYEFAKHPKTGDEGLLLLIKVFDHYKLDDEVWEAIKQGVITGISIGGVARDYEIVEKDGKQVKKYTNIETLEFSFVRRPANPLARIEQVNMLAKGILINDDTNKNTMIGEQAKELYKALKDVAEVEKEKVELAKSVKEEVVKTLNEMKDAVKEDIGKMKDEIKEEVNKSVEERLSKVEEVVKSLEGLLNKVVETLEKSEEVPEAEDDEKEKEVEKTAETPKPAAKEEFKKSNDDIDLADIF